MTKEQKEQFLNDASNYIIEEFLSYGIKFANPTIKIECNNSDKSYTKAYIRIGVYASDFIDGLKDTDEFVLRMFLLDTINGYIEKSGVNVAKLEYFNTDVQAFKNQDWISKLSEADQLVFCIRVVFME